MRLLCQVSPYVKFPKFLKTTALQHEIDDGGFIPASLSFNYVVLHPFIFNFTILSWFGPMYYTSGRVKSSGSGIVASAARILGSSSGNSTVATFQMMS